MSMVDVACSGYFIEHASLVKVCPKEIEDFTNYLKTKELPDWNVENILKQVIHEINDGVDSSEDTQYVVLATAIINKFEKETGLGLDVVENSEPSRFDDIEGYAYLVENAIEFTKEAKEFKKKYGPIQLKRWTMWG